MRTIRKSAASAAIAVVALFALDAGRASAQGPTPEGTVISNEATASFTDANGNTYTDVTASVDVTVGFLAGPTVSGVGSLTPPSPSTGNVVTVTITNNGNGIDQFSLAASADAGLTIDEYVYNGTSYASLALLNTALAAVNVNAGADIDVDIVYDVASGQGGSNLDIGFTATSVRDNTSSDSGTLTITPTTAYAVDVSTADGPESNLPSNGTQYSISFDVENTGSQNDTYDLDVTLSAAGATVTIVSVNGTAGSSSTQAVASGGTAAVTVIYTVNDVAAGSVEDITLTAESQGEAGVDDSDLVEVTVVRPAIAMVKSAYRDDQTTLIDNGAGDEVLPGETFQYLIEITNSGTEDAVSVEISDPLAPSLTYVSATGDVPADWTIVENTGTVTATLNVALQPTETRSFWIRVTVD